MQYNNISQGKPNTEPKCYIDIKSKGLWAIIDSALKDASDVSPDREVTASILREDDLTVRESYIKILLNCPSDVHFRSIWMFYSIAFLNLKSMKLFI